MKKGPLIALFVLGFVALVVAAATPLLAYLGWRAGGDALAMAVGLAGVFVVAGVIGFMIAIAELSGAKP